MSNQHVQYLEEQETRRFSASSLISDGFETVNISIPESVVSLEMVSEPLISQTLSYSIQKVPEFLRQEEHIKCDYDPIVVSFGPYHHGKVRSKLAENFKHKSLELFVAGSRNNIEFFNAKVLEIINDVRICYAENSTEKYDNNSLAKMMLHDACFMINYMTGEHWEAMNKHLGPFVVRMVLRDMFLLENQIPFWFLKLLMYLKFGEYMGKKLITAFVGLTVIEGYKPGEESKEKDNDKEPRHLLEEYRRVLVASNNKDDNETMRKENNGGHKRNYLHSFRSITDLKAKGIHFKRAATNSLTDINFKSSYFYAELQLPFWYFSIYTKVFFLNMVAFEMCPDSQTDLKISTYINFMKSLIQSAKDVKELREKKIISNTLDSDEEVWKVYKDIKTYEVNDNNLYYQVKEKIQEHYNSKAKTWLAELIHIYFTSPWSAIALLAAIFLIFLTFLQTYFTVYHSS